MVVIGIQKKVVELLILIHEVLSLLEGTVGFSRSFIASINTIIIGV